jgi:RNA polymerase sigma-70 factor (ECF subfamily)
MTEMTDEELMLRVAREDDDAALVTLMEKYRGALVNHFFRRGVYHECEDLAQETFVRLFKARRRYRVSALFRTYLYHIAQHVWIDHWRKRQRRDRRHAAFAEEPRSQSTDPHPGKQDVDWALAKLPETHRRVVVYSVFDQLPHAEIAALLGIPVGTVKSRLHSALRDVRNLLESDGAPS